MLSLSAGLIARGGGSLVGVLHTVPNRWLADLSALSVELFHNIPLLVQRFSGYFVLRELLPPLWGGALKQLNPLTRPFFAAMLRLGLFSAARVAEQVRAGINSLPRGHKAAGPALGLALFQVYRYVRLPMVELLLFAGVVYFVRCFSAFFGTPRRSGRSISCRKFCSTKRKRPETRPFS